MIPENILCLAILILIVSFILTVWFNNLTKLNLVNKIESLKSRVENLLDENEYVGEFRYNKSWIKFKESDIVDRHDECRKVRKFNWFTGFPNDYWVKDSHIFYYRDVDIYDKLRKKIEKENENETNTDTPRRERKNKSNRRSSKRK